METKEVGQEPGVMQRLIQELFKPRSISPKSEDSTADTNKKLIAELRDAKNSPNISVEDLAVIDSWMISLERYQQKISAGLNLDTMDLADIEYIKNSALAVISK